MIKVVLETGDFFIGKSFGEVVRQMADRFPRGETKREYMNATARRVEVWDSVKIRAKTPEQFIRELKNVGVITEIIENYSP